MKMLWHFLVESNFESFEFKQLDQSETGWTFFFRVFFFFKFRVIKTFSYIYLNWRGVPNTIHQNTIITFPLLLLRKQILSSPRGGKEKHFSRSKIDSSPRKDASESNEFSRGWRRNGDGQAAPRRFVAKVWQNWDDARALDERIVIYAVHFSGGIVRVHIVERMLGTFHDFRVDDSRLTVPCLSLSLSLFFSFSLLFLHREENATPPIRSVLSIALPLIRTTVDKRIGETSLIRG